MYRSCYCDLFSKIVKHCTQAWNNLIAACQNKAALSELEYVGFGIFGTIASTCTMYSMSNLVNAPDNETMLFFYESMLMCSVCFAIHPLWPAVLKENAVSSVIWHFAVFYLLVFCSSFFVLLSNFNHVQFVIFIVNIIVVAIIIHWKLAVVMFTIGVWIATRFYEYYAGIHTFEVYADSVPLILYSALLSGTVILIFLRPKQDEIRLNIKRLQHLETQITDRNTEMHQMQALKYEFLRNIEHEIYTPINSIKGFAEILGATYDKLNDKQRRAAIAEIRDSTERLYNFASNVVYLSKLLSAKAELKFSKINLSDLVHKRVDICTRLYDFDYNRHELILNIQQDVIGYCDEYYMQQALDNLIINAMQYSTEGKITIVLLQDVNIEFSIADEGIGVPEHELQDIFHPFLVGSNTRSAAGGRGVGLTLCEKVIELHNGRIWAESDGIKGTALRFILPILV